MGKEGEDFDETDPINFSIALDSKIDPMTGISFILAAIIGKN